MAARYKELWKCPQSNPTTSTGTSTTWSMYCTTPTPRPENKSNSGHLSLLGKHKKHTISHTVHSDDELKQRHHPRGWKQDCRTCRWRITGRRPQRHEPLWIALPLRGRPRASRPNHAPAATHEPHDHSRPPGIALVHGQRERLDVDDLDDAATVVCGTCPRQCINF